MTDHIKREKSNSITHLVKIIAYEVFEENKKFLQDEILNFLNPQFRNIDRRLTHQENIHPHPMKGHSNEVCVNAGEMWTSFEDAKLESEVNNFISSLSIKHERTCGAIKARIQKRKLI